MPTHAFVKITISRNPMQEERTYLRTLPNLKKPFENRMEELTKEIEDKKQKSEARKTEIDAMKAKMDKDVEEAEERFQSMVKTRNTTGYWRTWSKIIERSILESIGIDEETIRKVGGRGEVKITKKCHDQKREQEDKRSGWDKKADKQLTQARRCEQMAYRVSIFERVEEDEKKETYNKLNADAMKKISNNIDKGIEEEKNLKSTLQKYEEDVMNKMLIPVLKRHAIKYHAKHDKYKKKAKEETKKEKQQEYQVKGKGEWKVCKDMQKETATPMIALKRQKIGPRGQKVGSITTKPKEIDETIQQAYGEIYKGNVANPRRMTKRYLKDYDRYIYKAKQAWSR